MIHESGRHVAAVWMVLLGCATAALTSDARAQVDSPASSSGGSPSPGSAPTPPATWPRTFQKEGSTLEVYPPQVDGWKDYSKIRFRTAFDITPQGSSEKHYGVAAVEADTLVDHEARTVLMTNLDVAVRFPGLAEAKSDELKKLTKECLPSLNYLDVSLDQVLAYLHGDVKVAKVSVNLNPPPMFYSDVPAILVVYLGQPQFKPIKDTQLMFAVNTNWAVLLDMKSSQYYLLDDDSWLTSPDPLKGPWTAAQSLPNEISKLPEGGNWDDVRKHIPGNAIKTVPRVLTSTEPAELIATNGPPDYTPLSGTRLMYVSNPAMPLFLDLIDGYYYYLVSGRWFRAKDVSGPWTAASADLPAEFSKIPADCPVGFVLASIPTTQEAQDAVLLAAVPHKATVNIGAAKLSVTYDGPPKFVQIQGTPMTYAVNTPYQVVFASGGYYCCYQGVWFVAPAATGAWTVCTSIPAVIYTIPPSCPLFNVTYVQVYSSTPTTVVVGYTSGYSGEYVATTGALMFGAGMLTGAWLASNDDCWYACNPCYYSYGCAAYYSYAYGGYYRAGGAYYGPHGGAGWGSAYNPATGTWARGGYAYGPAGAHWGAQAYNPFTTTYGAHAGSYNGYRSWGATSVSRGDEWASAAHQSGVRGTAGWAENSSGQWAAGAHSRVTDTSVAKTSSGDVYAGHDGNVYRQSDGQWQKYQGNGNWEDSSWNRPTPASQQQATSSASTESSWQSRMQSRSQNGAQQSSSSTWSGSQWRSNWENRNGGGGGAAESPWRQHDTQQSLNQDSWARDRGSDNAFSSFQSRSVGSDGFGGGLRGGGFRRR